jgi:hypothetical protein
VAAKGLVVAMTALLIAAICVLVAQASAAPCTEASPGVADAAALRPSQVFLAIATPRAGEMVTEDMQSQSLTIMIDYSGTRLVAPENARAIDEYHLAYFLDSDASGFAGTLLPTPRCDAHVVQSASTTVTFEHVMRGPHMLWVMLVGSNNVSVNPPVAASVSFAIR